YSATLFESENLFVPLLALACWLLLRAGRRYSHWPLLVLAGLSLGFATLTRSFGLLLLPIGAMYVFRGYTGARRQRLFLATAFSIAFVAPIAPWTIRNARVMGAPVLVATNGGSTFYGGNNDRVVHEPNLWGGWISTVDLPHRDQVDAAPNEIEH